MSSAADIDDDNPEWTEADFALARPARQVLPPTAAAALVKGGLDDYHWHEALHVANIVADLFERHLAEHPAVQGDPTLKQHAEKLTAALYGFYQLVGQRRPD